MMRVIDLFAGCGGLSLGFQNAGFEIVAAFDNWKEACDVYNKNFSHPIFQVDLSDLSVLETIKSYKPDMIIGGPPCQDFSSAGKRDESLGRANLTISYAQIVSEIRPQFFVMENVERILKSGVLKQAISLFKKAGYGLTAQILNASLCGVPQLRKRYFLIGHLGAEDGFLDEYILAGLSSKPMTVQEHIGEMLDVEHYYRHPRSYARRGIYSVHEPSATIRGVNRPLPKGYKPHLGDSCKDHSKVRPLTTRERSYIQTFPENFIWLGSKTQQEQMIGNSVPVNLAKYVASKLGQYINDFLSGTTLTKKDLQLEMFSKKSSG